MNAPHAETIRNKPFTLIELLVVIAIIAVLMGMLFPAIGLVRYNAKVTKAKSEMNAIIMAVKNYESTYGIMPAGSPWTNNSTDAAGDDSHAMTMRRLTNVGPLAGGTYNARGIAFLDAPANFKSPNWEYLDPWNYRYIVLMDVSDQDTTGSYDGVIKLRENLVGQKESFTSGTPLNGSVFVYSYGGDNAAGKAGNKKENSDLFSWR